MLDTMRAFVALNLDVAATRRVAEAVQLLRAGAPDLAASWVPPTKYHLTLRFLGDVDVGLSPALGDLLHSLTQTTSALRLRLGSFDAFPDEGSTRVLFVPVRGEGPVLTTLMTRLTTALDELGFPPAEHPFVPHVTVARLRPTLDLHPRLAAGSHPELGSAFGTELALYRSDLARPGAEYAALARHGFPPSTVRQGSPRPRPNRGRKTP